MEVPIANSEMDLVIDRANRGGGPPPPARGGGDGDTGSSGKPSPNRYITGIIIGIVSILMFFMALASAFLVRKSSGTGWIPLHPPRLLLLNTLILICSSLTLEWARRMLARNRLSAFKTLWGVTTVLGAFFLIGQVLAWSQLAAQGIYLSTNPASSFFYIFTAAHAVHLLGGIAALLFVSFRNFEKSKVTPATAAEVTSYYWHFMDGLWIFLLALLYLGK